MRRFQAGRRPLIQLLERVCFGVDQRLSEHHRFLEVHDIVPDGTASIIVIVPPWHRSKILMRLGFIWPRRRSRVRCVALAAL